MATFHAHIIRARQWQRQGVAVAGWRDVHIQQELEAAFGGTQVTDLELTIDERFQGVREAKIFGGGVSQDLIQMEAHGRQVQLIQFLLQ